MKLTLAAVSCLALAGCLTEPAPQEVQSATWNGGGGGGSSSTGSFCPPGQHSESYDLHIDGTGSDPWKGHVGVIVTYAWTAGTKTTPATYLLVGYDYGQQTVIWYMTDATFDDRHALYRYPESGTDCDGPGTTPGPPKGPPGGDNPDNQFRGICLYDDILVDAAKAITCGVGTCVPKSCADLGGLCGTVNDGCAGALSCGCPSGYACGLYTPNRCGRIPRF